MPPYGRLFSLARRHRGRVLAGFDRVGADLAALVRGQRGIGNIILGGIRVARVGAVQRVADGRAAARGDLTRSDHRRVGYRIRRHQRVYAAAFRPQHIGVVVMAAFDQRAGYAYRILVNLGVRDLIGHKHRVLVRDEEIHILGQIALGYAHHMHAEHLAADALGNGLPRKYVHACELVRGADQLVHLACQVEIAVVVRHQRVVERLRRVRDLADDVGLGRREFSTRKFKYGFSSRLFYWEPPPGESKPPP